MNDNNKKVLACIDGAALSGAVGDYAAWLAGRVEVPLKLLNTIDHHHEMAAKTDLSGNIGLNSREHLLEDMTTLEQQQSKARLQQGKAILATAKQRAIDAGIAEPLTCLQHGGLIETLVEIQDNIRVLVIGARGKIHQDRSDQIGAKLEAMIRSLHLPVLVVYGEFKTPQNFMIAYDGSEGSEKALTMVVSSPLYKGLVCHLVCVGKKDANTLLETAANKLKTAGGIEIISASLTGKAEQALYDYQSQQSIDMMVMGAFSHSRLHDILVGSFTHKMLINSKKPLLLLR
ncbi:MAG: universal stress protein UspA [Gammaproteobacteria bacterium HGW-Gammaproteobacteria-3]|nr:MAG: universal stress protein UspA [Gammaproteobacteria bacterium HGW-Gammaproteobacteria-3]